MKSTKPAKFFTASQKNISFPPALIKIWNLFYYKKRLSLLFLPKISSENVKPKKIPKQPNLASTRIELWTFNRRLKPCRTTRALTKLLCSHFLLPNGRSISELLHFVCISSNKRRSGKEKLLQLFRIELMKKNGISEVRRFFNEKPSTRSEKFPWLYVAIDCFAFILIQFKADFM